MAQQIATRIISISRGAMQDASRNMAQQIATRIIIISISRGAMQAETWHSKWPLES